MILPFKNTGNANDRDISCELRFKNAPVKVIRTGNSVRISAFVKFTGDADSQFTDTVKSENPISVKKDTCPGETYAEVAANAIMNLWKGDFDVGGQSLNVETLIYSNNPSPNNVLKPFSADKKQKTLKIHIGAGDKGHLSSLPGALAMRSHEGIRIFGGILNNESVLKWSVKKSSSAIVIYDHIRSSKTGKMEFIGRNWFEQTAAHEFGHALGLGDAYNAGYRGGRWVGSLDGYYAPYCYQVEDENGNRNCVYVPDNDIMLQGEAHNHVSDNDIRMVLNAYKTGKVQLFPRGCKNIKDRRKVNKDIRE
ncbi:MAG: hypothetical protein PHX37_04900 [Eubacteriales bacterium]|nr:hypothetical protein [Eubacteriales bacterium]